MPVLIDGYNLYYYVKGLYSEEDIDLSVVMLCRIIDEWSKRSRQKVKIIFDGNVPPAFRQNREHLGSVELKFTGKGTDADTEIEASILANTAPKLLTIVSSDLRIRKAAAKRRCKILKCDEFWLKLTKKMATPKVAGEPSEKRSGLASFEREYWLKVFGFK